METITLPIKCSTVKRIDSVASIVISAELFLIALIWFAWAIRGVWAMVFYYELARITPGIADPLLSSVGLCVPFAWALLYEPWLYLPTIECIHDERGD